MKVINQTTHRDSTFTRFVDVNEYIDGKFAVTFLSTFTGAKNPEEAQKNFQMFLDREEMKNLATVLQEKSNIRS